MNAPSTLRLHKVTCVVCGAERKVKALNHGHAFAEATASEGWTWRFSPTQEWCELLCYEHRGTPEGVYGDD